MSDVDTVIALLEKLRRKDPKGSYAHQAKGHAIRVLGEYGGSGREDVENELDMANGCLAMVEEMLSGIMGPGSMDATPPMFYPEAIMSACSKVAKVAARTGDPRVKLSLNAFTP